MPINTENSAINIDYGVIYDKKRNDVNRFDDDSYYVSHDNKIRTLIYSSKHMGSQYV
jgi:hypothetical protein